MIGEEGASGVVRRRGAVSVTEREAVTLSFGFANLTREKATVRLKVGRLEWAPFGAACHPVPPRD